MGEKNNALTVYMNRSDRIGSVLEYYLKRRLPQDWECQETRGFYTIRNACGKLSSRQRDFVGNARAWGRHFLLGLEHQENIGLTFPWRLMEMDCLAYGNEIQKNQRTNSADKARYNAEDDFQYRYKKQDRITPVLTLTLYWGKKPWKEPLSLADMMADMGTLPKKIQQLAGDYKVHLIQMRFIPDEDLAKMNSDLKYVLGIMKCTGSRKRYEDYIYRNREFFSRISKSAVDVIDTCTSIKDITGSLTYIFNPDTGEEETDMCKALRDIKKHAERKGKRQGTLDTLISLVTDRLLQLEEAAKRAGLSSSAFCDEMKKANGSTIFHTTPRKH